MDTALIVSLVKDRLGIRSTVRDKYLEAIVKSVVKELEDEKGLVLDGSNDYQLMFCVDYATWRYQNRDHHDSMPRHLQFRLHNLMIHVGSKNLKVNSIEFVDALPTEPTTYTVYILPDDSKQMYIDNTWAAVDLVNGSWVKL